MKTTHRAAEARRPLVAILAIVDLVTVAWAVSAVLDLFR